MPSPALPARKAGGRRAAAPTTSGRASSLPILNATELELPDGTKVPIKIPPGMPAPQAAALIEYLRANPEAAKQMHEQAQQMLKTPGLAQAFMGMQANQTPENMERLSVLKDDEELKHVWDDILKSGPGGFEKYWNDDALMSKISQKLRLADQQRTGASGAEAGAGPKPKPAPGSLESIHDAAKFGDVESAKRLVGEGKDVNEKNDKGVAPLGIAVGFNRVEMVQWLLESGADVHQTDGKGNTSLHYAAGYGRKEAAEALIAAGARLDAENEEKKKPIDVAKQNREKSMVEFLRAKFHELRDAEFEKRDAEAKAAAAKA